MSEWGQRIKRRREELGLSQAELARRVGIRAPSVNNWESGATKTINGPNLQKAAAALERSADWILYGRDQFEAEKAGPTLYAHHQKMQAEGRDWVRGPGAPSSLEALPASTIVDLLADHLIKLPPQARPGVAELLRSLALQPEQQGLAQAVVLLLTQSEVRTRNAKEPAAPKA